MVAKPDIPLTTRTLAQELPRSAALCYLVSDLRTYGKGVTLFGKGAFVTTGASTMLHSGLKRNMLPDALPTLVQELLLDLFSQRAIAYISSFPLMQADMQKGIAGKPTSNFCGWN